MNSIQMVLIKSMLLVRGLGHFLPFSLSAKPALASLNQLRQAQAYLSMVSPN